MRARNIKPGFFTNDKLAELPPLARLLFAGLWCLADREGRLIDRPRQIKAQVLPYDRCNVDQVLLQLQSSGFIRRYTVGDENYIAIINFRKHQHPHVNEAASTIPAPCESGTSTIQTPVESDTKTPDSLSLDSLSSDSLILDKREDVCPPDVSPRERTLLSVLKRVYLPTFKYDKDLPFIRNLFTDYPNLDLLEEAKKWETWLLDNPKKQPKNFRSSFRNWCKKAVEIQKPTIAAPEPSPPPSDEDRAQLAEQLARFDGLATQFLKGKVVR